jgi:hypothetical protein
VEGGTIQHLLSKMMCTVSTIQKFVLPVLLVAMNAWMVPQVHAKAEKVDIISKLEMECMILSVLEKKRQQVQ